MTAITFADFLARSQSCLLQEQGAPTDHAYLGYVPVTWGAAEVEVGEADDWREVPFFHPGNESEALAELQVWFGEAAEAELYH